MQIHWRFFIWLTVCILCLFITVRAEGCAIVNAGYSGYWDTITSPVAGQQLTAGSSFILGWNLVQYNTSTYVSDLLMLYYGGSLGTDNYCLTISSSTLRDDQQYSWTIPDNLASSELYSISVVGVTPDGSDADACAWSLGQPFNIVAAAAVSQSLSTAQPTQEPTQSASDPPASSTSISEPTQSVSNSPPSVTSISELVTTQEPTQSASNSPPSVTSIPEVAATTAAPITPSVLASSTIQSHTGAPGSTTETTPSSSPTLVTSNSASQILTSPSETKTSSTAESHKPSSTGSPTSPISSPTSSTPITLPTAAGITKPTIHKKALSTGAIAGIAVAAVLLILLLILGAWRLYKGQLARAVQKAVAERDRSTLAELGEAGILGGEMGSEREKAELRGDSEVVHEIAGEKNFGNGRLDNNEVHEIG